jgi:hypothetical protein
VGGGQGTRAGPTPIRPPPGAATRGKGDAHLEVDECEGEGLERVIVA